MPNHTVKLMSTPQCVVCGLYTCIHKSELTQPITSLDLGETVGETVSDTVTKIRVDIKSAVGEKVEPKTPGNIVCPHCKTLVTNDNFCYQCGKSLKNLALTPAPIEKETVTKNLKPKDQKEDLTAKCSMCGLDVIKTYIVAHLNVHINEHIPDDVEPAKETETSVVSVAPSKTLLQLAATSPFTDKDDVNLKAVERFHYRKIDNLSVSASTSEDQSISDFTVTVWLKDRASAYSGGYAGSSWHSSTDSERLVINTTFDTIDEYCSVSVRLIKTSQYGHSTEDATPERLCFDQTEIKEEIKRALLFFKVPPRSVYKRFRKAMRNEEFVIELGKNGNIEYVQTANANDLLAKLKDKQVSSSTQRWDAHTEYYGCGE